FRIYSCVKKIPFHSCEVDSDAKQFSFCVPHMMHTAKLYILITPEVHFKAQRSKHPELQGNTIDYLKVLNHQPYKFYELTLEESKDKNNKVVSVWNVKSMKLDRKTGKIPDETIIVCYDPACVDSLSGGSAFELPTIQLKQDLLALLGSEDILQDLSNKLLLSSIDSDTVHAPIMQKIKHT